MKVFLCLFIALTFSIPTKSQILISLLFGDKLNSEKIEFGLDGGLSASDLAGINNSELKPAFFLGLYFDFKLSEHSFLHTGVIMKSPFGAKGINPYSIGVANLDSLLKGASVQRNLEYFSLPLFLKYKFDSNLFMELGPQIGFLRRAEDDFVASVDNDDDLDYTNPITDDFKRWDIGVSAGIGYKLLGGRGINLGVRYYLGLSDINNRDDASSIYNRNIYVFAGIPIGSITQSER